MPNNKPIRNMSKRTGTGSSAPTKRGPRPSQPTTSGGKPPKGRKPQQKLS